MKSHELRTSFGAVEKITVHVWRGKKGIKREVKVEREKKNSKPLKGKRTKSRILV